MRIRPDSTERSIELLTPRSPECQAFSKRFANGRKIYGFRDHKDRTWFYDAYRGQHAIRWIERFLRHKKGEWAGKQLLLAPWQKRITRQLFGWFDDNGCRKHREAWIEIPRKNGKSTWAAAIGNYLMVGDGEPAAEIYSVAGNEAQARLVYSDAVAMVEMSPELSRVVDVAKAGMMHGGSDSRFKALGKGNQHGLNPHGIIGDEVHEWKGRDQYEAVSSAMGARRSPLALYITTAGHEAASLCGELHRTALQVKAGILYRPDLYVAIFAADLLDDWRDEATWYKANPGLRYGAPKIEYLRAEFLKAQTSKSEENKFKRLYLNIWTDSHTAWIPGDVWRGAERQLDFGQLRGDRCFAGLDLAKVHDLSALALLFPPGNSLVPSKWILGARFWCPEDNIRDRSKSDNVDYAAWRDEGLMTVTPGNTTDFDFIERDIIKLARHFQIEALGFDAFLALQCIQHMQQAGINCVEVRQGFVTLAPPTAEFERMVLGGELIHGGQEIMSWCIANTVCRPNPAGDYKPDKGRSSARIDGAVAAINALALSMASDTSGGNLDSFLAKPIVAAA